MGDSSSRHIPSDLLITLERTGCYGVCPIYKVTVDADGKVVYEGEDFVACIGRRVSSVERDQVLELINLIHWSEFFSLKDEYQKYEDCPGGVATDSPTAIISARLDGKHKEVRHYCGCFGFVGEKRLIVLERAIDRAVNINQWIAFDKGESDWWGEYIMRHRIFIRPRTGKPPHKRPTYAQLVELNPSLVIKSADDLTELFNTMETWGYFWNEKTCCYVDSEIGHSISAENFHLYTPQSFIDEYLRLPKEKHGDP